MQIHAIQTGTVTIKASQTQGKGYGLSRRINTLFDTAWTEPLPIYAWVIEHPEGVIVVDTGDTARTSEPGYFPWWHPYYHLNVRMSIRPEDEIGPQLRMLGITPKDVRQVVLTHLHTDHAGGLHHFPHAEILVSRTEYQLATSFQGRIEGYLSNRWPAWFAPRLLDFTPSPFGPFPSHYTLTKAGDVILVPTPGHTPGHLSVIVQEDEASVFCAGDTSYTQQLLLAGAVDGVSPDDKVAKETIQHIQQYLRTTPTVYLPSHDPASATRLQARTVATLSPSVA